jgi:nucleoside-diphosphate-sugar epimerase
MEGIDVVIHLAARAHIMDDHSSNPLAEYRRINVDGTATLAEAASNAGVKRLIFLSSIKVNGEQTFKKPYAASDTPAPENAYGISKAEAEEKLKEIAAGTGLEAVIIRTPLVYGPGAGANFLSLVSLANSGLPLPFGAITKNRRSLIYIGNLVDVLVSAAKHPTASGQTFLVRYGTDHRKTCTPALCRIW